MPVQMNLVLDHPVLGNYILVLMSNGNNTVFGKTNMTERGVKSAFTRYTKRFGLTRMNDTVAVRVK